MTDKDINIVDLSEKRKEKEIEENKLPEFAVKKLKYILEKADEGKLNSLIVSFAIDDDEKDEQQGDGGTLFFSRKNSILEVIGTLEIMKANAFEIFFAASGQVEED